MRTGTVHPRVPPCLCSAPTSLHVGVVAQHQPAGFLRQASLPALQEFGAARAGGTPPAAPPRLAPGPSGLSATSPPQKSFP